MSQLCVVVPCYNEAKRLPFDVFANFARSRPNYRFLMVNDGSTDRTAEVLAELAAAVPGHISAHSLPQNSGKAEAVRTGMTLAFSQGFDYVAYWDADLATPLPALDDFVAVLDRATEVQVVLGSRVRLLGRHIERRPRRHYIGRVFATIASLILRLPVYDTQCGAKMFRNTVLNQALFQEHFSTRWIFDVELLARLLTHPDRPAAWPRGGEIYELPLAEWRDIAGSKLKFRDGIRAFWDLWRIARRYPLSR